MFLSLRSFSVAHEEAPNGTAAAAITFAAATLPPAVGRQWISYNDNDNDNNNRINVGST